MDKSQYEIAPQVWADCRRALFFEKDSILAVADLHLGYAWAHRFNGQMMPIDNGHPGLKLLEQMVRDFRARKVVVLGDIIHQAVPVPQLRAEVKELLALSGLAELLLLTGNHDKRLASLIDASETNSGAKVLPEWSTSSYTFLHGDKPAAETFAGQICVIGHEHPAISLGDGVSTSAKFPCFLASDSVLALPAFSPWAAGTSIGSYPFMSPLARGARFHTAVAVMGKKLLPVPLNKK
ncbi:MAG: metallophosphoesterase [Verrucomicrobiales bacterium]